MFKKDTISHKVKDYVMSNKFFTLYKDYDSGILWTDVDKSHDHLKYYLSNNYIPHSDKKGLFGTLYLFLQRTMFTYKRVLLRKALKESNCILDYGSGDGKFAGYLKKKGKKEGYHFIRVSPFEDESVEKTYEKYGFRHAPIHMLAETTWLLDLSPQAEDLLKAMNKNHRNLIRRCERDGVIIKSFTDKKALEQFNVLHDETAKRHHFVRFSDSYVEKEFEAFSKEKQAVVFHAYLPDGRLDAAAVVYYYKHMASYRHGASLMLDKKHPSSYALQWAALNEGKKRGVRYYNFWGIAPKGADKKHPFFGITHFKKGFGGEEKELTPCQDLPISCRYWITWAIETIRRIKRGF